MAKRQIEIEILAKGKPAERSIDKVDKKTKKLAATTKASGAAMSASWVKVGIAIVAVTAGLKKATEAHSIQLKAELALGNALRLNAKQGEDTLDMWKDYASALQEVTIFGDEMTLQQVAMLKTMGLSDTQTKELIETAMDYATAFGKDVPSAVRELTMTLSGQLGTIKRTIPSIGEFTKEQLKSGEAIKAVSALMKGQAKALADTPWGESVQNVNQFGDEMESVGKTFLQFASDSGGLTFISRFIEGLSLAVQFIGVGIKSIAADITLLFEALGVFSEKQAKTIDLIKEEITAEQKLANAYAFRATLLKDLTIATGSYREAIERQLEIANKQIESLELTGDVLHNVKDGSEKAAEATVKLNEKLVTLNDVGKDTAKSVGGYFADMVTGVKSSFEDMARGIISRLLQVRMEALVTQSIASAASGGGTLGKIASFFTSHTGTAEVKHTGGAIGMSSLPSFHSGFRSDERLAKLQVGEAVVNRAGAQRNPQAIDAMNSGMPIGGGGNVTTAEINFNVTAIDSASFNNYLVGNKTTIENIINRSLQTNGTVRQTIKQVV